MKTEINNENKAKFFALYWGQRIQSDGINLFDVTNVLVYQSWLELKPLSSISDEDAEIVARIITPHSGSFIKIERFCHLSVIFNNVRTLIYPDFSFTSYNEDYKDSVSFDHMLFSHQGSISNWIYYESVLFVEHYLRSKGYALPWMGLSVEEMVKAGWIKLTES